VRDGESIGTLGQQKEWTNMRDNYRDIAQALARREGFTGNSMTARRDTSGNYVVWSYDTRILFVNPDGTLRYFDNRQYSQTTSRHQSMIRQAFPEATKGDTAQSVRVLIPCLQRIVRSGALLGVYQRTEGNGSWRIYSE
jgi:hypothetical protein